MEFSPQKLVVVAILSLITLCAAAIYLLRVGSIHKNTIARYLAAIAIVVALLGGSVIGTFHSHGIDIAWWVFGLVIGYAAYLLAGLIVFVWPGKD